MLHPDEVRNKLVQAFPNSEVLVEDMTGTMDHFQVLVISRLFEGKTMVEQHQLVYKALGDLMKEAIHALALKTYTPEAWK
ncbi:MAG TPA: BolA family transcriptional regulator, partial [Deltaproteobacteria bacterium]|nr:BolA family transcriptional regulator [Deltaproteobacteria bacterium]